MSVLGAFPVMAILPAQDLDRAVQFYQGTLGLELLMAMEAGAQFAAGNGTTLFVYPRPGGLPAEHTVAGWLVDDVYAVVEALEAAGVLFEYYDLPGLQTDERGVASVGGELAAWFRDSEGNILAISQFA